jgi:hypothetical protein
LNSRTRASLHAPIQNRNGLRRIISSQCSRIPARLASARVE